MLRFSPGELPPVVPVAVRSAEASCLARSPLLLPSSQKRHTKKNCQKSWLCQLKVLFFPDPPFRIPLAVMIIKNIKTDIPSRSLPHFVLDFCNICIQNRGVRFRRIRDLKQDHFNNTPPTSHSRLIFLPVLYTYIYIYIYVFLPGPCRTSSSRGSRSSWPRAVLSMGAV